MDLLEIFVLSQFNLTISNSHLSDILANAWTYSNLRFFCTIQLLGLKITWLHKQCCNFSHKGFLEGCNCIKKVK